ncbi:hypothetical protein AB0F46_25600 [Streptomyces sp. NPDC026665]|uniref:hypothetical protein n=1 Tax=Streptomyces sp. NPDC026665 TaxID=3154798 RepID=UPI0033C21316
MINTRTSVARLGRMALTTGTAFALLTALPMSSAQAATGSFDYQSATGESFQITDPNSDTCYSLTEAVGTSNGTDERATIYSDANCEQETVTLTPGQVSTFGAPQHGVRFSS